MEALPTEGGNELEKKQKEEYTTKLKAIERHLKKPPTVFDGIQAKNTTEFPWVRAARMIPELAEKGDQMSSVGRALPLLIYIPYNLN